MASFDQTGTGELVLPRQRKRIVGMPIFLTLAACLLVLFMSLHLELETVLRPLVEFQSKANTPSKSPIQTLVCHRPLFGSVSLHRVRLWADYHRKLGFDHVVLYYEQTVLDYPGFDKLLVPWITTRLMSGKNGRDGQIEVEVDCLRKAKGVFDWVLVADSDEFLWMANTNNVKDFLEGYDAKNTTMLSLSKVMYSGNVATAGTEAPPSPSLDGLGRFAFTAGLYCYHQRPMNEACPGWVGRSKILAKPQFQERVNIHGDSIAGATYVRVSEAHMKEWAGWQQSRGGEPEFRDPVDFLVNRSTVDRVGVYFPSESYPWNANGTLTIRYDPQWPEWIRRVVDS